MGSHVGRVVAVLTLAIASTSGVATAATYAKGIDVSHYQGKIQWPRVAGASVTFAFGKATEGTTYTDPTYPTNRTGSESAGLTFGAYHFARPAGSGDAGLIANAIAQADYFLGVAQPQVGELPPVLDLETKGALTTRALRTWTSAWLQQIAARTGVAGLIYASPNFWKTALGDTRAVADAGYPLWIAHWTTDASPLVPAATWGGRSWTFWQYSSHGTVAGITPQVDLDRFRGSDPSAAAIGSYPGGVPTPSATPTVVGTPQAGKTLAAVPGAWGGGKPVAFTYQWQRCAATGVSCTPVVGATTETYVPVTADVGHRLTVAVTAQSTAGAASASAPPTVPVSASGSTVTRPAATAAPAVSGIAQVGQTLTLSTGSWTGAPTAFTYAWRRCSAAGTQCVAIAGATISSYTLTPDDIGATISPVVTATGKGGSTSAPAATTAPVVAAPVPPATPGSAVAGEGVAGAVSTLDGTATVTWQPGAIPPGSTVALRASGKGLLLEVSPAVTQLPWAVDVTYAAPTPQIVGTSTDNKIWHAAPRLATPALGVAQLAGTYVDAPGLTHVLLRTAARIALFTPGVWGDPTLVAPGPPTPRLVGRLQARRLHDGSLLLTARVRLPSQAHLWVSVKGPNRQSLLRRPGIVAVHSHISGRALPRGAHAALRVAARDPWGRTAALVVPFRAP